MLIRALDSRVGIISKNAIVALGKLESEAAIPELIAILKTTDSVGREYSRISERFFSDKSRNSNGEIGGARAAEAVARRLADNTAYIVALEDAANRKAIGADDQKRNWSWEVIVNAAKK